jgi:hypothetical protein
VSEAHQHLAPSDLGEFSHQKVKIGGIEEARATLQQLEQTLGKRLKLLRGKTPDDFVIIEL